MKKLLTPLLGLLLTVPAMAQQATLPQRLADKACDCIGQPAVPDSALTRLEKCLPQAFASVVKEGGGADAKVMNTVEGIRGSMRQAQELLGQSCPAVRNAVVQQKQTKFYATSSVASAAVAYQAGSDLLVKKQYAAALPHFLTAIKRDPQFVKALDDAAVCYRQTKDLKKAEAYYEKSLSVFPEGNLALLNMAVVKTLQHKDDDARTYYEKLRFFHPYDPEGYFGAGKMALLRRDFPQAMQNLFSAHRLYVEQESPYLSDSNRLLTVLYSAMKEQNQLDLFRSTAKEYNLNISE
ncbi:Tetratricopeptide repeat-containing protein [Hymenobacter gelipurpurascens]|uniref:Tetratricopeptide repeat-containing protein n=1 Tax=Hymenobacter gelipurpurascens TaxID=89968 RepID=A0A212T4Y6_9BACT|nr:tetratricopeptide repeat protein [Hymenobacter gelipurpurascens]SNC61075.1 Tetratricopeptide repeat-containing protein [Hymenobacter gelipurpurascens]